MKKVISVIIFIMLISITACSKIANNYAATTATTATTPIKTTTNTPDLSYTYTASGDEYFAISFKSKEGMYKAINNAKGGTTKQKIEDIVSYFDFTDIPEDIYLDSINIKDAYIALEYTKEGITSGFPLTLELSRGSGSIKDEDEYLKYILEINDKSRYSIVTINGKKMVKGVIYNGQASPVGNDYHYVQDGEAIHIFCPSWLWEKHTDEEFLNVKKVTVPVK